MEQPTAGGRTRSIPSLYLSQASLTADPFYKHRIIADPEWSLLTVPRLTELCLQHIVHNFESKYECLCPRTRGDRASVLGSGGSTRQADASERQSVVPSPAKGTDGEKYPLRQPVKQTV